MELVTGYKGADHVTAEQLGDLQAGFAGYEHCILPVGRKLEAEVVTANKVRIFDGALLTYGRQCVIEAGAYEDVVIENGSQGLLRNDMIIARYVKNEETGIESVNLAVIKGITGETAKDPVPLNGNIRDGAFENEMPLYRVKLRGLAIEGIEPLFNVMMSVKNLEESISSLNGNLKSKTENFIVVNNANYIASKYTFYSAGPCATVSCSINTQSPAAAYVKIANLSVAPKEALYMDFYYGTYILTVCINAAGDVLVQGGYASLITKLSITFAIV